MSVNDSTRTNFASLIEAGRLQIGDGYRAKNEELGGNGVIFLRAGHVSDEGIDFRGTERFHTHLSDKVAGKMARPGDAVVTTKGNSTGRVAYIRHDMPPFVYSPHLSYWRSCNPNVIQPRFLYYWSRTEEFQTQLRGMSASTDMAPYLSLADQKRLRITLPPHRVQQVAAETLGSLDDKIELNRRTNETLEAMARTLFRSWFVEFDPVRAKADGQKPHGMDTATAKLFPDSFEPSALGPIPKGWRVGVLSDLLTISRDGVNPLDHPTEAFDHYSIPAFDEGRRPQQEAGAAIKSNKYLVPASAVLLSKLNPRIPRVWLPNVSRDRRSVCSTEFLVCQAQSGYSREFLHSYQSSAEFTDEFASLVTGTSGSHQRVKPDDVLRLKTLLPDGRIVRAYSELVQPLYLKAAENIEESRTLAATRDALLPKLLSGEVSVSADHPHTEVR